MVLVIRKAALPTPTEVPEGLREAADAAASVVLREPRPAGFPVFFSEAMQIIEPVVAFLHEHGIQRTHTADTVRTYAEILYDWFDTLEQNSITWNDVDGADLVAYRNRMLTQLSPHTGRAYAISTINQRVRGVLRFYQWAVRSGWLAASPLAGREKDFTVSRRRHRHEASDTDRSIFVLRQFESLPRPLSSDQARELLAQLPPPYDLMARWQLYTGLRIAELLRLTLHDVLQHQIARRSGSVATHHAVHVMRKGRKGGYVIASESLFQETDAYIGLHRTAWLNRASRRGRPRADSALFIGTRGTPVRRNTYQQVVRIQGDRCGFIATPHRLRATFACMMLARLEQLAKAGEPINPLLIVKILMSHEHIGTTDRYLRAIAVDTHVLANVLESLLPQARGR
jgi:integrase/recombinase XerD